MMKVILLTIFVIASAMALPCKTKVQLIPAVNNRTASPQPVIATAIKDVPSVNRLAPAPPAPTTLLPWGMFGNSSQNSAPPSPNGSAIDHSKPFDGLFGVINGGHGGSATAGGSGSGSVQNGAAAGTGTGVANAGPGGFGIGLGVGIAVETPLGSFATGQGQSAANGK